MATTVPATSGGSARPISRQRAVQSSHQQSCIWGAAFAEEHLLVEIVPCTGRLNLHCIMMQLTHLCVAAASPFTLPQEHSEIQGIVPVWVQNKKVKRTPAPSSISTIGSNRLVCQSVIGWSSGHSDPAYFSLSSDKTQHECNMQARC